MTIWKFIKENKLIFVLLSLGFLLILIMMTVVGWDCILHNIDCPPPTNVTGLT